MGTPDNNIRKPGGRPVPVEGPSNEGRQESETIGRVVNGTDAKIKFLPILSQNTEMPRQGNCGFIAIPLITLQELDTKTEERFHRELMGLSRQKGTYNVSLQHNCLIIVNTAERPPEDLASVAASFKKIVPTVRVIWGDGEVKHDTPQDFSITHFPSPEIVRFVSDQEDGTYATTHLADTLNDPSKREGEHLRVHFSPTAQEGAVKVDKVKKLIAAGGNRPDKFIGNEVPLTWIKEAINDPNVKVLIVEAPAGLGKTRIINEALKGKSFTALANSASLKSRPGGNLARLAEQAHDALTQDALFSDDAEDANMPLTKFGAQTREEQIQTARKHPTGVTRQIVEALAMMNQDSERPILVIEDFHHTDYESEAAVQVALPYEFLQRSSSFGSNDTGASGLVIITMRGNQMDQSPSYKRLLAEVERTFGQGSTETVSLTETPLDFTQPEIYNAFAFHGLDRLTRGAKEMTDPEAKDLGSWPEALGKVASALGNSPHVMTTLVDRLREVAVTTDDAINIKPEDLAKITAIRSRDDLATVYEESFKRLTPNARTILFAFALLGGKISQPQFHLIINNLEHPEGEDLTLDVIEELEKSNYIRQASGENYELSHENLVEFVLQEAQNDQALAEFLLKLQEIFAPHSKEAMDVDAQFALYNNIAKHPKITSLGKEFWGKYEAAIDTALDDAVKRHDIQRAYGIGSAIMEDSAGKQNRIRLAVEAMIADDAQAPENLGRIGAKALLALAKNAAYLGKFAESKGACEKLTQLTESNPAMMHPREAALVSFRRGFMAIDMEAMQAAYAKIEKDPEISEVTRGIVEIQFAYRNRDYKKIHDLKAQYKNVFEKENTKHLTEHGKPSPEVVNIFILISARAPYEELLAEIHAGRDGKAMDEDTVYHPGVLTPAQRVKLNVIKTQQGKIKALIEKWPELVDPFNKISAFEVDANLETYDDIETAIALFAEAHRQAEKLGVFNQAARQAVLEGKRHLVAATRKISAGEIDFAHLESALAVFNQKGDMAITLLGDKTSFYTKQLHGERLRATGLYCYKLAKTTANQMPEGAKEHIEKALEDCKTLFEISSPANKRDMATYFSYIEYVIQGAEKLGIPVPAEILSSIKMEHISQSLAHSDNIDDRGLGDLRLKEFGLFAIRQRIRNKERKSA